MSKKLVPQNLDITIKPDSLCNSKITICAILIDIITGKLVTPYFQPIVDLRNGEVYSHGVTCYGPQDSILNTPENLIAASLAFNLQQELQEVCNKITIQVVGDKGLKKNYTLVDSEKSKEMFLTLTLTQRSSQDIIFSTNPTFPGYHQGISTKITIQPTVIIEEHGVQPKYIVISCQCIGDMDKKSFQQTQIKATAAYAHTIGAVVLATDVSTADELVVLMELGIDLACGSLFGRPSSIPSVISEELISKIKSYHRTAEYYTLSQNVGVKIGDIVQYNPFVTSTTIISNVEVLFGVRYQGIVIVDDNIPVGLLMKNKLYYRLGTPYGVSLYLSKPAANLMDQEALIVDAELPLETVSQMAMNRLEDSQYDLIIVVSNEKYVGVVSVTHLLQQLTNLQIRFASNSNPLTGLPGNLIIEERLKQVVEMGQPFAVLYCDLDNFKAFNDKYGFEQGDCVLQFTASVLRAALLEVVDDIANTLLGHIGGDDFIILTDQDKAEKLCKFIVKEFDEKIKKYYEPEDIEQECIMVANRKGKLEQFPLMSISIGVVHNRSKKFSSYIEIGEVAAQLKKMAKKISGSAWVFDQRNNEEWNDCP